MKLFSGITAGASLAAFMAVSAPAQAQSLLGSESLDQGYGQSQTQTGDEKKDDKAKKKKKGDKDGKGDKEGSCGEGSCGGDKKKDGDKKGDKEGSCGEGSCG